MKTDHTLFAVTLLVAIAQLPAQATWTRLYPAAAPSLRGQHAMAFDGVRNRVLLFGGTSFGANPPYLNDLWEWDGATWQQVTTNSPPPPRVNSGFVFDSNRGCMVLFGGSGGSGDTWELTGNQWTHRTPVHHPSPRDSFGMAFDSVRSRTVLFGGEDNASTVSYNDTWEWDGTDWQQRTPATSPLARRNTQLVFDAAHGVCVLFGGYVGPFNSGQAANDTWTWDGTNWQMQFPASMPGISYAHRLTYDAARSRVVGVGFGYYIDPFAWEWDGQTWSIVLQSPPGPSAYVPIAYDPNLREVVYYGSQFQVYANCGDTWIYRTPTPATVTAYGDGCAGSAGTPTLTNAPYSLPWLGDTFRMRAAPLASTTTFALFALGLDPTAPVDLSPYGMPGCSALVAVACYSLATASNGSAELSMVVPNTTSLAGAHIFEQAFAVEPGANAAGVVVSNGADVLIGIR